MFCVRILLISIACWTFALLPARAGAWLELPGHGQLIITSTFSKSVALFDAQGRIVPASGYRKFESSLYVEYGLTDRVTLVAAPTYEFVQTYGQFSTRGSGAGWSQAGVRVKIAEWDSQIVSAQSTYFAPNTAEAFWGSNVSGAEIRLMHGMSFEFFGWRSFTNLELGVRRFAGWVRDEIHLDATMGLRPWPQAMVLLQSLNTIYAPLGVLSLARQHKLQASIVYDFELISLQAGAFITPAGASAGVERGLVWGVWRKF